MTNNPPDHLIDKAWELAALGKAMAAGYERQYGSDPEIDVAAVEQPLEFDVEGTAYLLKPDMLYRTAPGKFRLMEHKTAATVRTGHLVIDGQARPYGVLAERAFKKASVLSKSDSITGIMYNFLRKALPDERERDAQGRALNKNGSVSARQSPANFVRHFVTLTRQAKIVSLRRIQIDVALISMLTDRIRSRHIDPAHIPKTSHNSCVKTCQFFTMCVAEEDGIDITDMRRSLYLRRDPYQYEESTDEPVGFEMG